jgi:hypothetical protein
MRQQLCLPPIAAGRHERFEGALDGQVGTKLRRSDGFWDHSAGLGTLAYAFCITINQQCARRPARDARLTSNRPCQAIFRLARQVGLLERATLEVQTGTTCPDW